MCGRSHDETRSFRARTLSPWVPETAAARATGPAPRAGTFARARPAMVRTTARRSALQVCRVRGRNALPPSDSEIENEKTRGGCSPRGSIKLVSMMSFCRCFARRVKSCVERDCRHTKRT
jgi:hypothetical protein